jgi:hypothetical protein
MNQGNSLCRRTLFFGKALNQSAERRLVEKKHHMHGNLGMGAINSLPISKKSV